MLCPGERRVPVFIEEDVIVTDGALDIEFGPKIGLPTVAGIKVEQYERFGIESWSPSSEPSTSPSMSPSSEQSWTPSSQPSDEPSMLPFIGT